MISRISFHELAELELREAAQYYDSEVPGLGSAFLDEIDYSLHQIVRHRRRPINKGCVSILLLGSTPEAPFTAYTSCE